MPATPRATAADGALAASTREARLSLLDGDLQRIPERRAVPFVVQVA
jgi:hypothetical protein